MFNIFFITREEEGKNIEFISWMQQSPLEPKFKVWSDDNVNKKQPTLTQCSQKDWVQPTPPNLLKQYILYMDLPQSLTL